MKQQPLESAMTRAVANADVPVQELLRKIVAQPQSYSTDEVRSVERRGLRWSLRPHDYFQWNQLYGFADEVLELLVRLSRRSLVVFDVGANIGFYSLVMATQVPSGGRVFSFEPNPQTLARLQEHISLNRAQNVEASGLALSEGSGSAQLHDFGEGESGKFSLRQQTGPALAGSSKVQTDSLDDRVQAHGLSQVDLIKVDVEGHEPEVFLGSQRTILEHHPFLCFEITPRWYLDRPEKTRAAFAPLLEAGYEFFHVMPHLPDPPQLRPLDLLAAVTDDSGAQYNVFGRHKSHPPWAQLKVLS